MTIYNLLLSSFVYAMLSSELNAYSTGPPTSVCSSLTPNHGGTSGSGNGGYIVSVPSSLPRASSGAGFSYQSGASYVVRIEKSETGQVDFKGFAIQAVQANSTNLLGTFSDPGSNRRHLSCTGNNMATVTHSAAVSRSTEEFTWTAPTGSSGAVDFRYTIVRTRPVYFAALVASADNFASHNTSSSSSTTSPTTGAPATASGTQSGNQQQLTGNQNNAATTVKSKAYKTESHLIAVVISIIKYLYYN